MLSVLGLRRLGYVLQAAACLLCCAGAFLLANDAFRYANLRRVYRPATATIVSAQPSITQKDGRNIFVDKLGVVYSTNGRETPASASVIAPAAEVSPAAFTPGRSISVVATLDPARVMWIGDKKWPIAPEFDGRAGMLRGVALLLGGLLFLAAAHSMRAHRSSGAPQEA